VMVQNNIKLVKIKRKIYSISRYGNASILQD